MIVLACETSTLLGSVAVVKDGVVISLRSSMRQGSHSDVLNGFVEQALADAHIKLSEVDLFASGIGPGSFTGIRIALNAVKSFAFCFNKPCIGLDSLHNLAALAVARSDSQIDRPIIPMVNAYKNMVYAAKFILQGSTLICQKAPQVVRVQNLNAFIQHPSYIVGDGYEAYKTYFDSDLQLRMLRRSPFSDEPEASALGLWAAKNKANAIQWNELIPLYLRESEAEENAKGIKYQPLI